MAWVVERQGRVRRRQATMDTPANMVSFFVLFRVLRRKFILQQLL